MKKADKLRLSESLDKALAPPRRPPQKSLDDLLGEYDDRRDIASSISLTPSTPSTTPRPSTGSRGGIYTKIPIAPIRDFQKVANSITREAIKSGLFIGKSKQLYDYLYSLTRGSITPSRDVRISKGKLMTGAAIGSEVTLRKNLLHLRSVGLLRWREVGGTHGGNEYTVLLPEELTPSSPPTGGSPSSPSQFLEGLEAVETRGASVGLSTFNSNTSEVRNTFNKTNTDDDDAFREMIEVLRNSASKLTGSNPKASEGEKWAELARVIANELNNAAAKTGNVSSVPAFLTAHLKRRLTQRPVAPRGKIKVDDSLHTSEDDHPQATKPPPDQRLTAEEIVEQSRLIAELLEGGYTLQQADSQFAASFHQEDWKMIKEAVSGQTKNEGEEQVTGIT